MRLIDADALMNELMKVRWAYQMLDNTQRADIAMGGLRNAEKKVEEAPTVYAVPVVWCKDCKHKTEEWVVSNLPILCADLDGFESKEDWDRWKDEQKAKGKY